MRVENQRSSSSSGVKESTSVCLYKSLGDSRVGACFVLNSSAFECKSGSQLEFHIHTNLQIERWRGFLTIEGGGGGNLIHEVFNLGFRNYRKGSV